MSLKKIELSGEQKARVQRTKDKVMAMLMTEIQGGEIDPLETLAMMSRLVGSLIAFQNKQTATVDMLLDLVQANIQLGNAQGMEQFQEIVKKRNHKGN